MLRNFRGCLRLLGLFTVFRVGELSSEKEPCIRKKIGIRDCSAENCFQCTISSLDDYSRIPGNVSILQLFFSSEAGLGPSSKLPLLDQLREMDLSVSNAGPTPAFPSGYFSGCRRMESLTFFHDTTSPVVVQLVVGSFSGLSSLTKLMLSGLGIRELPAGVFNDLSRLKILDLSQNELTKTAKGTFANQRELNTLYLGNNRISSLVNVSFEGLDSLRVIDLHQNQIRSLGSELGFLALRNLTEINLANNGMLHVYSYAFTGLQRLEKLYLEGNSLAELTVNVFNDLVQLRELDLKRNRLKTLPVSLFSYLRSLEYLHLGGNKLERIAPDAFDGLKNLKTMDLGSNEIRTVDERAFEGLGSVKTLKLNGNQLRELSVRRFLSLHSLEKLDLRNNSLETMTLGPTDDFEELSLLSLDLSLNPWNCNCDIYWLVIWLQRKNPSHPLTNRESTRCRHPEALRDVDLVSAYADQNCPHPTRPTGGTAVPEPYSPAGAADDAASNHQTGLSRGAEIGIVVGSVLFALAVVVVVVIVVCNRLRRYGLWDRLRSESIDRLRRAKKNARQAASSTHELAPQRPEPVTSPNAGSKRQLATPDVKQDQRLSVRNSTYSASADAAETAILAKNRIDE